MVLMDRLTSLVSPAASLRRGVRLLEQGGYNKAFPLMASAARAGIVEAEYRVARCYLEGEGVPQSRTEGIRWLKLAAKHENADAQALLAALYLAGFVPPGTDTEPASTRLFKPDIIGEPDFEAAVDLAKKAAEAGSAAGQALLGYILTNGPEGLRDAAAALDAYEQSAAGGCAEGSLGLALLLARRGLVPDQSRIVAELRRAADGGLPTAVYLLGVVTENGLGIARDNGAAAVHYESAAESGVTAAQLRLGLGLLDGSLGNQDAVAGEAWMRRAAMAGNAEAAFLLGERIVKEGGTPNYVEAAGWFRQAADRGHEAAARALASLYFTGNGVAKDADEGARLLRAAATGGNQDAQIDLANLVMSGGGGPDDPTNIARWFESAAKSGDRIAAFNLGLCFAKGVGVRHDEGQAAEWLRRAAEGVAEAQYMYARVLQDGRGVPADAKEARTWFTRAAKAGLLDAQVALAEMLINGRGGSTSPKHAKTLFEHAASKGHAGAMFALGVIHSTDHGVTIDQRTAQKWFMAAAKRGHGQGELMIGRYLSKGIAGERNLEAGRLWLKRAVAHGVDEANEDLAELSSDA